MFCNCKCQVFLVVVFLAVCCSLVQAAQPAAGGLGDPDMDGIVTIIDALAAARYSVGLAQEPFDPDLADVCGGDGVVTILDALTIAWYALGLIFDFPRVLPSRLRVEGRQIVDPAGRPVSLNGLVISNNCWGTWVSPLSEELQAEGWAPMIRPLIQSDWVLTEADVHLLGDLGVKAVRYEINHELFAVTNPEREKNMEVLKEFLRGFRAENVYMILNMHLPVGRDVAIDGSESWRPGDLRTQTIYEDEEFWQEHLAVWKYIASELRSYDNLAGYEPDNEPRLPSDEDGGVDTYRDKWNELCREIREEDPGHIIFVPEYNSREANPGEAYWHPEQQTMVTDQGEQGIIWERGLVKIDNESLGNIVYVFHAYDPFTFTHSGEQPGPLQWEEMKKQTAESIAARVSWAENVAHAPLINTEYGVNKNQPMGNRIGWLNFLHAELDSHGISSLYYCYKAGFGVYVNYNSMFAVYGEYATLEEEIISAPDSYAFINSGARDAAEQNGFILPFDEYYWREGELTTFSLMGNGELLECLQAFWQN